MQTITEQADAPRPHRFDVDDYYRMAEVGVLGPEDLVELIEGRVLDSQRETSLHSGTLIHLTQLVSHLVADDVVIASIRNPLRLDRYNEPVPDLKLLRPRADFYCKGHPTATDVLLLVEVADSSLAYDRGPKLALYARHGVPEVWLVDLVGRAVEICREPGPGGYAERRRLSEGLATPTLVPGPAIDVAALLA